MRQLYKVGLFGTSSHTFFGPVIKLYELELTCMKRSLLVTSTWYRKCFSGFDNLRYFVSKCCPRDLVISMALTSNTWQQARASQILMGNYPTHFMVGIRFVSRNQYRHQFHHHPQKAKTDHYLYS